jgi:DnaJ-class molecular chaperone
MGLSRTASRGEVRVAYRRMAMRLHPDMNADPAAAGEFNYLCEAYRVLSNPEAREAYDELLSAHGWGPVSVEVEQGEGGEDEADEAEDPRAAPPPEYRRRPTPGVTRYVVLRVPRRVPRNRLTVRFDRRDPCRRCGGTGLRRGGTRLRRAGRPARRAGAWGTCRRRGR